jgi:N4-gp56 family major capsid protein
MALQTTGSAGLSPEMKTFYDRVLLRRTVPSLLYAQFGQKRPIPANGGKTIEFRKFSGLAVAKTALTEGQLYTNLKDITVTSTTATIAQYGDAVGFSDLVSTTTIDPVLTETTQILGEQSAETIDELVRDVLVAGTNVTYAGGRTSRGAVTASDVMSPAEVRKAVLLLKLARAPKINGKYHAIIHPRQAYDLINSTEWRDAQNYNRTGRIFDGSLGELYGVVFWETDKAPELLNQGAGSTVDIYQAMFFGAEAYGIVDLAKHNLRTIYKALGSAGTADPLEQQQTMGWKVAFATKILQDMFLLRYETAASTAVNV